MMIPILVLLLSFATLVQFAVGFCRYLLSSCTDVELSKQFERVTGLNAQAVGRREIGRLMTMIRLAPASRDDATQIRWVSAYHSLISGADLLVAPFSVAVTKWCDAELSHCAYFMAVALDRRIVRSVN